MPVLKIKDVTFVPAPKGMPTEIDILGEAFEVRYSDNLYAERDGTLGVEIEKESVICVDVNSSPSQLRRVLTHEVLHACLGMADVHGLDHEQEETVVRCLTTALHYVLRNNNPWWFDLAPDDFDPDACPDDCDCCDDEPVKH